ncbi:hypothetical protein TRIUR3_18707 [Triticum urartu]|uniref:Uncharacterized protein n=1 Tax=Triticum urartu TaxID=4572 RepID=M8A3B2_TRIUA|nr:hypothetical protein TRIUR3_18707 [Triticum urartu]
MESTGMMKMTTGEKSPSGRMPERPPPPRTLAAPSCILPSLVRPKLLLLLRPHMLHPEHAGGEAHREAPEQLSQSPSVQEEPRGQRSQQRWRVQELGLDGPPAVREGHVRAEGQGCYALSLEISFGRYEGHRLELPSTGNARSQLLALGVSWGGDSSQHARPVRR